MWRESDADAVYAACQDPETQRWLPALPRPYTRDDAEGAGRGGNTTRAVRRLCRSAFDVLRLERLALTADVDDVASQRVAEKVGFRREGVLRSHMGDAKGSRRDSVLFSLLPGELC